MRRSTDRLIALQFLAVVVPIAFVLLAQMITGGRRAAAESAGTGLGATFVLELPLQPPESAHA